jgi:site-specific recombinase XerD
MNEVRRGGKLRQRDFQAQIIRSVETARNLPLLKDYQAYLRVEKGLRPLTCEAYLSDLRIFAEFIEGRQGVLLTAAQEDVSAFLEHLRNHNIDSRSAARKLSCLRGFYKWLLLDNRIHHDPTVNIESPQAWKVLPKSLAEPEVAEMLERAQRVASHPQARATDLRDSAILELLYAGGLRVSEVTALSTGDLALDGSRCEARAIRSGLCRSAAPRSMRLKPICARDGRTWRASVRQGGPGWPGPIRRGCFFPCAACR